MPANRYRRWASKRWDGASSDGDDPAPDGSSRRVWPFLLAILIGLTLLYLMPQVTLIATVTLTGAAAGLVMVQRRPRRRHAPDPLTAEVG